MSHSPLDKIQALDAIEKEIITCLQSAGQSLQELGKEKTSQKAVENNTQQFLKSLNIIETKLSEQINYLTQVSTGQPHEGSGYASAKVLQMAWHRIQHARSRVRELDDSKSKYMQAAARQQRQQQGAGPNTPTAAAPSPGQPTPSSLPAVPASSTPETTSTTTPTPNSAPVTSVTTTTPTSS
ncbi:mediator of RNA polymerase II transcription subunit 11 [Sitodiplosis mosellana]|uniref:mediator of RNA polymerase II transcription subunit 11 n=1 Tax=Sitodiplosis mosellana TaxID=263140 RepID=UPI002443DA22|nr:mediator of RNA polymerase II transcription subunit 11 [Sitodiplosis mosellana]